MSDEAKRQLGTDSRPIYESPRALRLGDARTGSGQGLCDSPGSSAGGCWGDGAQATECDAAGIGGEPPVS